MPGRASVVESLSIRVTGLVQGVGFRPTVWRLAHEEGLAGFVLNDGAGVLIEATGPSEAISRFCQRLRDEAPPLARIENIDTTSSAAPMPPASGFVIKRSIENQVATGIVPDAAACPACIQECFDVGDRRHNYAFTNCTHCGPRLSIVTAVPYDRAATTMAAFAMCADCAQEYEDPANRRFHAQPNACPICGPRVWLECPHGARDAGDPIEECARLIADGQIMAVKGIGGFHLACDASNEQAVNGLRRRKDRDDKPLALMVRDFEMARSLADIDDSEWQILRDIAAPIVLVRRRDDALLANGVAPGHHRIGIMLPYTPLHHLLLAKISRPLVMTSGNVSDEPQCTSNADARKRLAAIADGWLMHDRDIANRLDDSVVRIDHHGPTLLRRARGFAPAPIQLAPGFRYSPAALAFGAELKATFCLARNGTATISQHLGDLEEPATCDDYRKTLELYRRLYDFTPEVIAVDKHPDYASHRWGVALANELGVPLLSVQHHHAHLAAALAEHGIDRDCDNALGIVLDGTGLGDDGTIWGGEFLLGGYRSFRRVAHMEPIGLPGGVAAVREPWRNTFAHLRAAAASGDIDLEHPALSWLSRKPIKTIEQMLVQGINTPLASSAGRLFDAVAGALDLCRDRQTFEGQAAMSLETLAVSEIAHAAPYPFDVGTGNPAVASFGPMWNPLLHDLELGVSRHLIAARFHHTLIDAVVQTVMEIGRRDHLALVALSGGVFQNSLLLDGIGTSLEERGLRVLRHRQVPCNDGGVSLGQAAVAMANI
ncbi:MAG: carbamoyltransferase HypF [Hyphomicrobiaceae bacterium]|nr:carbamoyltransferase HypF [Hyphomicrobiaceae bacterium]